VLAKDKARELLGRRGNRWLRSPERFLGYFSDARNLLVKKGWCQGAYARSRRGFKLQSGKDKSAASFCAEGALERATPEHKDFKLCKTLLSYALGVLPSGRWSIASINDDPTLKPEVAQAQILAGYDNVIDVLEELV
jgi:hypothetical protein